MCACVCLRARIGEADASRGLACVREGGKVPQSNKICLTEEMTMGGGGERRNGGGRRCQERGEKAGRRGGEGSWSMRRKKSVITEKIFRQWRTFPYSVIALMQTLAATFSVYSNRKMDTATTETPYLRASNLGATILHGPHHVVL